MGDRSCRYCQQVFQPSKFQPRQTVCGEAGCQRKRRSDYHREKIAADPEYREVCQNQDSHFSTGPDSLRRKEKKLPFTQTT